MARFRCDLLCEDQEQEGLFRRILERHGGRVRVLARKPHGGFTFVLAQLKPAVAYVRQKTQEAVGLLVVIDGDEEGLAGRLEEIRSKAGLSGAPWEAKVAVCVPTRNVETWKLWLWGRRGLDESTDYKSDWQRLAKQGDGAVRQVVAAWFRRLDPAEEEAERHCLPALAKGRAAIERLVRTAAS